MALTWKDTGTIAETLYDNDPDLDPTTLRFTELHDMCARSPASRMIPRNPLKRFSKRSCRRGSMSVSNACRARR